VKTNSNRKDQIFISKWNCRQSPKWFALSKRKTPHQNLESSDITC